MATYGGAKRDDVVTSGSGDDLIDGEGGNNALLAGGGRDAVLVGARIDNITYSGRRSENDVQTLTDGIVKAENKRAKLLEGNDILAGVERIRLGDEMAYLSSNREPVANAETASPAEDTARAPQPATSSRTTPVSASTPSPLFPSASEATRQ